jgi:hypothetical protein
MISSEKTRTIALMRKKKVVSRAMPLRARCENDQCRLPK